MKQWISSLKKHSWLKFVLLYFVVLLAYGQTTQMYFWQDDSALMFKLQHPDVGAGSFGTGILGLDSPYRYLVTPFVPFFPLFHLEPRGYFIVGILLYFLSAVSVYFLAKQLTKNNLVSLVAGLVYSCGYIGSDTMWRIINSYQTSLTIILICFALIMYHRYIEKKGIVAFIFALLAFLATIEFGFVRGHGVVLFIIGMELLYNFSFLYSPLRLIPFIGLFYRWYLDGNSSAKFGPLLLNKFLHGDFTPLVIYFQSLRNLFIPDWIAFPLWLFVIILTVCLVWKRSRILLFSLVLMMGTYAVYFVQYQDQSFSTTHRYITPSFIGLSIFLAVFLSMVFKRKKFYIISTMFLMLFYLGNVNMIEYNIIHDRSIPARKFYSTLQKEIPQLSKGSVIYFDVKGDGRSQIQFGNFFGVGSMPESTAVAIYYGLDRYDVALPSSFDELLFMIQNNHTDPGKIFTFTYDANNGLKNSTAITRKQLFGQGEEIMIAHPEKIYQKITVPFKADVDIAVHPQEIKIVPGGTDGRLAAYLNYFVARKHYYDTVNATASSQWKYNEIDQIDDNNGSSIWMSHRMSWHYGKKETVTLNLGEVRTIGGIIMTAGLGNRIPTEYTYFCSEDNVDFQKIKSFSRTKANDFQKIFNTFDPVTCQYIRLVITKDYDGDAPQIAEIEAVDSQFGDIDIARAELIKANPFSFVYGELDKEALIEYFSSVGYPIDICIHTNQQVSMHDAVCKSVQTTGGVNSVVFPQSGSILKAMSLKSIPGVYVTLTSATVKPLTYKELQEVHYIRTIQEE